MKNLTIIYLLIFSAVLSYGQTPCVNGTAGQYPCKDYDLMSRIPLSTMSAGAGNDSWGGPDPTNGKEYAIIGLDNGTASIPQEILMQMQDIHSLGTPIIL